MTQLYTTTDITKLDLNLCLKILKTKLNFTEMMANLQVLYVYSEVFYICLCS